MVNLKELQDQIKQSGLKKSYIADQLSLSGYGLQKKLQGENEFKVSEVSKLCEILKLNRTKRDRIFFTK